LSLAYLVIAWTAVVLVDAVSIGGLGTSLRTNHPAESAMFILLFGEGRVTELLQWSCLLICVVALAGFGWGSIRKGRREVFTTTTIGAAGIATIFLEDTINLRHLVYRNLAEPMWQS